VQKRLKRLGGLLDFEAAARYADSIGLPRDRETIRRAAKRGQIPFELHGGKYYVLARDVKTYLRNVRRGPAPNPRIANPRRAVHQIRKDLSRVGAILKGETHA